MSFKAVQSNDCRDLLHHRLRPSFGPAASAAEQQPDVAPELLVSDAVDD